MTKVITINSCRECPYRFKSSVGYLFCNYDEENSFIIKYPDNIHPDCKLNDLPTVDEIEQYAIVASQSDEDYKGVIDGATFVINKINGK